jgi:hypothetical protein
VLLQEDPTAEHLLGLAGRLDCFLRLHCRRAALIEAQELLHSLCDHHRALHLTQRRRDDPLADELEDQAVALIARLALLVGELRYGDDWPDPGLRTKVAQFAAATLPGREALSKPSSPKWNCDSP